MKISEVCESYFNGFQEVLNFKKNGNQTNVLALLKILSYFTGVIFLGFAVVYGVATLCGRISKKTTLSCQDKSVNNHAKKTLFNRNEPEIFQVKIQKINGMDKISYANFGILDIKINEKILELLIEYYSQENPEVQLLQDKQSGKLYLAGGKTDNPIESAQGNFVLAKPNLAKIFIDLSPLEGMENIDIYEKTPGIWGREGNNDIMVKKASENFLISILNFKECNVRMFGSHISRHI